MDYEIAEKDILPQLALTYRQPVTMETIADRIGGAFRALVEHAARSGAQWAGPPFILYPEDCSDEFVITVCMPVAPGATGGEQVASRRCRAGRSRPRCTSVRTTGSAKPTWRCRSG